VAAVVVSAFNQPVVGIALDKTTGGYWWWRADGGVFSFDAPFYGRWRARPSRSK
jgi:hypothetical protein